MQVIEVGDAFARSNADGTSWTVGTEAVEVTYTAREGLFALTGFSNKLTSPPTLYRPRAPLAPEPAGNGPWRLREAATSTTTVGGQRAALLTLRLMHHDLAVCLRVIAYPGTAVLRQWLELENTATSPLAPEPTVFTMEIEFVLARCWQTTPDGGRRELPALSIPDGYPLVLAEWLTPAFRRGTPLSPTPSSWLLTRRLFDDLGGLDPAIPSGADWRFVTRALLAGRRVVLSVTPLLMYHNTLGSFGKSPRHDLEGQANRNIAFLEGLGPRAAGAAAPLDEATHRAIMFATCRVRVRELLVFGYLRGAARFAWRAWCCRVPLRQRLGLLPLLGLLAIPAALTRGQCRSWSYLARGLRRLRWNLRGRHTPPAGPP